MQYFLVFTSFHCLLFEVQPPSWLSLVSLLPGVAVSRVLDSWGPDIHRSHGVPPTRLTAWPAPFSLFVGQCHFHCLLTTWLVMLPANVMYCTSTSTVLYCTALHCTVRGSIILYCTILYYTVLYCTCTIMYSLYYYCTLVYLTIQYTMYFNVQCFSIDFWSI